MFDLTQMQQMVFTMFSQQKAKWPPELREALNAFQVKVIQNPDCISIVCENNPGAESDPNVEKAKKVLLDSILGPLPQIIGSFGPKVTVYR